MKKMSSKGGKRRASGAASPDTKAVRGSSRAKRAQKAMSGPLSEKIKQHAKEFNPSSRKVYLRAMEGRSRKDAMTAMCIECMGYNPNEVKECTSPCCALYPYR